MKKYFKKIAYMTAFTLTFLTGVYVGNNSVNNISTIAAGYSADVDGDGQITSADALKVLQIVVGLDAAKTYTAIDYIGLTVNEVLTMYGNNYSYEYIDGGYFLGYPALDGLWIHAGENADYTGINNKNDVVRYTYSFSGKVTDNIEIGMTATEIRNVTGSPFEIEFNEMDGEGYCGVLSTNNFDIILNFNDSYILTSALIKS
ncbi:MAG: hypothetical protein ACI4JM_11375 [Oscillospiraceae bacterium]